MKLFARFSTILFLLIYLQALGQEINIVQPQDTEVIVVGQDVIVKSRVKGVLVFGGDAIIEGKVEGDVATIGGSVQQKSNAFIGGDIIVLGGKYSYEDEKPLRSEGKQTIIYAGYEEELRHLIRNPVEILQTPLSWEFLAQRLLSIIFWFLVTLGITTIAPKAISQSVTALQLSTLKIFAIGTIGFIAAILLVVVSLLVFPSYVSTVVALMVFLLLILAYVFGRVALQIAIGKKLQKHLTQKFRLSEKWQSESIASFLGTAFLVVMLSVPYVWVLIVFAMWSLCIGATLVVNKRVTP
ncbi:MAG: hypothetical protein D6687_08020 [Acidobacteria bacterium]|jgi:hypothetical protein|nr:MAG: hypothetical protein D6687_08020 [Acidobacteriota bacterium]GIU81549.1 MAG: hypothetical protein KatS3mg006_0613 [Pyrinomonadaceae bacterium]